MNADNIGLGLIGCGDFGIFCMEAYSKIQGVKLAAVADVSEPAAKRLGDRFDIPAFTDPSAMVASDDVQLVHIATPPSSHYELVLQALHAGKHVLCEKPLAMNTAQGEEMLALASERRVLLPVNFVLRYNRVTEIVKRVIESGVMGKVLSARLTNCASDSKLDAKHWFWAPEVCGGIFIEHGVHFFDLYSYWLGELTVLDAHTETREGTTQEDRVMCTLRSADGAIAHHYHGFDQLGPMDRADHRIVCERGDIRIDGWIPLELSIHALVDSDGLTELTDICGRSRVEVVDDYGPDGLDVKGRGHTFHATQRVRLACCPNEDKQTVYAESVQALLTDQIAVLRDPDHKRVVTESNGLSAVALAERAASLAASG